MTESSALLDARAAARTHAHAPAIITRTRTVDYAALLDAPGPREARPLVLRATPQLDTVLAIHAAIARGQPILPIAPDTPSDAESSLALELARLPDGEERPLAYIVTSGSSGTPKLVELTRAAYAAHSVASNQHLALRSDDRWLVALPLSHTGGLSILVRCLAARAAVVLGGAPPWGPRWIAWLRETIAGARVTRLSLVPAQLDLLVGVGVRAPSTLRSVLLGGQAVAPSLATRALALGWPIIVSYGMTETCGMCAATRAGDDLSRGIVGRALAGTRFRIASNELLEIDSPSRARRVHGASPPFTEDEWLRTADRAELSGEVLTLLGRADELIVTAGHKVDPSFVEAQLLRVPFIRDAAVAGVPDARFGAAVAALLVIDGAGDAAAIEPRLAIALEPLLEKHQRPRHFAIVGSLPRLGNGKLDRRAAQAMLAKTL